MAGLSEHLPAALRQSRPVQVLEASFASGRLAHAILLRGERLEALEEVALALAGALLNAPGRALSHPDLFTLRPAKKARQIRIGERGAEEPNTMRRLLRDLSQSSNQGGRKVAIVYEADRMNTATANAFLKTLEEPPRDTTLLLLTTRPYALLDTIRSRCFNFRLPSSRQSIGNASWADWSTRYHRWLKNLLSLESGAGARANAVMGAYGLVATFLSVLQEVSDSAWQAEQARLPESMESDEREAQEVGVRKSVRNQLWAEIELTTRLFAIEISHHAPYPSLALARAIEELEALAGLLEVNLKEDAALEHFFLRSLRIWSQAREQAA